MRLDSTRLNFPVTRNMSAKLEAYTSNPGEKIQKRQEVLTLMHIRKINVKGSMGQRDWSFIWCLRVI